MSGSVRESVVIVGAKSQQEAGLKKGGEIG